MVKVTRVDIKTEVMDLPEGRREWEFLQRRDDCVPARLVDPAQLPLEVIKTDRYLITEVNTFSPLTGTEIEYFLVKVNDKDLFEGLIKLTDEMFKIAVELESTKKYVNGITVERERIEGLSWWRRLFKRF